MRFHRGPVRLSRNQITANGRDHPEHIARTIEEIAALEERAHNDIGFSDHLASRITALSGSMLYVWLHVAWFAVWILVNVSVFIFQPFDPYPFGLLTMIVSLEAIFLSTFVLITQNRQAIQADHRARVDLEVNLIAEREITKIIEMLAQVQRRLGIDHADPEAAEMRETTDIKKLADTVNGNGDENESGDKVNAVT